MLVVVGWLIPEEVGRTGTMDEMATANQWLIMYSDFRSRKEVEQNIQGDYRTIMAGNFRVVQIFVLIILNI